MVALLAALALASPTGPYSFGRESGNIVPFTVTIAQSGAVRVTGPVKVGRTRLTAGQLAVLAAAVSTAQLATLPPTPACPGTLPDIASTWIKAGSHRVQVHGSCSPRFTRVWNALASAVHLSYG
jgi:hypothetical protein